MRVQKFVFCQSPLYLLCVFAAENSDNVMSGMVSCMQQELGHGPRQV